MRNDKIVEINDDEVKVEVKKKTDKKEVGKGGRPKTDERQKKKPRQVYFSDAEFEDEIAKCAEFMGLETKDYMEMAIRQQVKKTSKFMEEE